MAEEKSDKIQKTLAKPTKIDNNEAIEFEEVSENYNIKGKRHKLINCTKYMRNKEDSNYFNCVGKCESDPSNAKPASGNAEESFQSDKGINVDQQPLKIVQGDVVVDLNVYNKQSDEKKDI
eukprot:523283_1